MGTEVAGVFKFGDPTNVQPFKPALTETLTGRVEFFLPPPKYFGFIIKDGTNEKVFFHGTQILNKHFILRNDRVHFSLGSNKKGVVATKISLIVPKPAPRVNEPAASAGLQPSLLGAPPGQPIVQPSTSAPSVASAGQEIATSIATKRIKPEPDDSQVADTQAPTCSLCDDEPATITFHPCNHRECCLDCSIRIKKCMRCNKKIESKTKQDGMLMVIPKLAGGISSLLALITAQEEAQLCSICFDQKKSIVFNCGHLACSDCANSIDRCHLCLRAIQIRTRIYEF